jgi:hypothetical protein
VKAEEDCMFKVSLGKIYLKKYFKSAEAWHKIYNIPLEA